MKIRYCVFVDEVCVYVSRKIAKALAHLEFEKLVQQVTGENRNVYLKEEMA